MAKKGLTDLNFKLGGPLSLLELEPVKEYMKEYGEKLILTSYGEIVEGYANAAKGAFSLWNLLAIPANIVVGKLMKDKGFTDLAIFFGKIATSSSIHGVVGFCAGGPAEALASVALCIVSEVVVGMLMELLKIVAPAAKWLFEKIKDLLHVIYNCFKTMYNADLGFIRTQFEKLEFEMELKSKVKML